MITYLLHPPGCAIARADVRAAKLQSKPLDRLAREVRKLQNRLVASKHRIAKANNATLNAACAAGIRIAAAKTKLKHGEFLPWLRTCGAGISEDRAEYYMRLAAHSADVRNLPPGTTLNKAYGLLSIVRPPVYLAPSRLRRELKQFKVKLRDLSRKVPHAERSLLAKEIHSLGRNCDLIAQRMEAPLLLARMRERIIWEATCDCAFADILSA